MMLYHREQSNDIEYLKIDGETNYVKPVYFKTGKTIYL